MNEISTIPINDLTQKYFSNNLLQTYFLNSLSSTFKYGEKFFMKSLSIYVKEHPEFKERIIEFNKEERTHTNWHIALNKKIDEINGTNAVDTLQEFTCKLLNVIEKLPNKDKLLITEALEHITYSLCKEALDRNELVKLQGDAYKVLYAHSLEETGISHSTIAGDVYRAIKGNKIKRKLILTPAILALTLVIISYTGYQYKENDKPIISLDTVEGMVYLLNPKGWLLTSIVNMYKTW